jgi:outer membrane immunogenic protein
MEIGVCFMRKLLGSVAFTALLVGSAMAADMNVRQPVYKAPPVLPPAWSWTGFYLGINGGYSTGTDEVTQVFSAPGGTISSFGNSNVSPRGGFFGGQLGYNYQIGSFVWGVEGDAQWADQHDTACGVVCASGPGGGTLAATVDQKLDWFSTARARLGWANEGWLFYVTGGGAWAGVKENDTFTATAAPISAAGSFSSTKSGWALGGGVETHLFGGWTGKLEYLHMDFGSSTTTFTLPAPSTLSTTTKFTDDIIRAGINYKFW